MKVVLEFAESICRMVVSSLKSDPELKCIGPILDVIVDAGKTFLFSEYGILLSFVLHDLCVFVCVDV